LPAAPVAMESYNVEIAVLTFLVAGLDISL
jgi:hypothetical protein